ncbi:hypothetical protein SAMN04489841_4106 [Natrinema salaciae]|uniref:Uncharacterized protein n=1 Tax=Natrinema salaciae TaxID=1186196 RepID=A0A1H9Q794_9EURY|nr:hypothetical protein SAMN04489841_4106 [Natrinema salaciae]
MRAAEEGGLEAGCAAGRHVRDRIADVESTRDAEFVERVLDVVGVGLAPLVPLERRVSPADDVEVEFVVVGDERGSLVAVVRDESDRRPLAEVTNRVDIVVGPALARPKAIVGPSRGVRLFALPEPRGIDAEVPAVFPDPFAVVRPELATLRRRGGRSQVGEGGVGGVGVHLRIGPGTLEDDSVHIEQHWRRHSSGVGTDG